MRNIFALLNVKLHLNSHMLAFAMIDNAIKYALQRMTGIMASGITLHCLYLYFKCKSLSKIMCDDMRKIFSLIPLVDYSHTHRGLTTLL